MISKISMPKLVDIEFFEQDAWGSRVGSEDSAPVSEPLGSRFDIELFCGRIDS